MMYNTWGRRRCEGKVVGQQFRLIRGNVKILSILPGVVVVINHDLRVYCRVFQEPHMIVNDG